MTPQRIAVKLFPPSPPGEGFDLEPFTTLFHRFGIHCLGWNAQHPRQLDRLLALGIDGVFSDHVDRMVDALGRR